MRSNNFLCRQEVTNLFEDLSFKFNTNPTQTEGARVDKYNILSRKKPCCRREAAHASCLSVASIVQNVERKFRYRFTAA